MARLDPLAEKLHRAFEVWAKLTMPGYNVKPWEKMSREERNTFDFTTRTYRVLVASGKCDPLTDASAHFRHMALLMEEEAK